MRWVIEGVALVVVFGGFGFVWAYWILSTLFPGDKSNGA